MFKDSETITRTKGSGTYGYRAPEAIHGKYNEKTDVFSVGMIATDLLQIGLYDI